MCFEIDLPMESSTAYDILYLLYYMIYNHLYIIFEVFVYT